jgi:hypothetical protein
MAERLTYLDFEDDGDTMSVDDFGRFVSFRNIDHRAEIEINLDILEVDRLIAWLATWKENQES